jgi:hypothetical protein
MLNILGDKGSGAEKIYIHLKFSTKVFAEVK